jgi:SAM-dependent methyltransferase
MSAAGTAMVQGYYADKLATLADLFGVEAVTLDAGGLRVGSALYPIVDDVIVLLPAAERPVRLSAGSGRGSSRPRDLVQSSFGDEWTRYGAVLAEHADEFARYFDLVDLAALRDARVCDLGCGNGRWSALLAGHCRQLVLVDFSEAIFVARRNLAGAPHALFFLGDVTALPFRPDFADFAVCLGVLHHLPQPALTALRAMREYAPRWLVYLYYALDTRPWHFRAAFRAADALRRALSRTRSPRARRVIAVALTAVVYKPLVAAGHLLELGGRGAAVPLFETYRGKSFRRVEQDAYDRFFTGIEQRVSRRQIQEALADVFEVRVSPTPPYWHFLCERRPPGG